VSSLLQIHRRVSRFVPSLTRFPLPASSIQVSSPSIVGPWISSTRESRSYLYSELPTSSPCSRSRLRSFLLPPLFLCVFAIPSQHLHTYTLSLHLSHRIISLSLSLSLSSLHLAFFLGFFFPLLLGFPSLVCSVRFPPFVSLDNILSLLILTIFRSSSSIARPSLSNDRGRRRGLKRCVLLRPVQPFAFASWDRPSLASNDEHRLPLRPEMLLDKDEEEGLRHQGAPDVSNYQLNRPLERNRRRAGGIVEAHSFPSRRFSLIGSAIAFCGAACVYFLVPDRKFTLEEEDEAFKAYLQENGWDTEGMMGLEKKVGA